ncbi:MAG TPA: cupredoxin domain-containing protein [Patescibacteria group bacterium]|nr:cupredoxin domain-containing protein [Patescibacteria group bacterium]
MIVGRTATAAGLGLAVAVLAGVGVSAIGRAHEPIVVQVTIHYSHFEAARITVPAGRPVTFVIRNTDPIDHEWIVGDDASHERHRTGTEPTHGARPTEVSIPAGAEIRTTVTFAATGSQRFICHLPGHERYGMVGTVVVTR